MNGRWRASLGAAGAAVFGAIFFAAGSYFFEDMSSIEKYAMSRWALLATVGSAIGVATFNWAEGAGSRADRRLRAETQKLILAWAAGHDGRITAEIAAAICPDLDLRSARAYLGRLCRQGHCVPAESDDEAFEFPGLRQITPEEAADLEVAARRVLGGADGDRRGPPFAEAPRKQRE